MLMPHLARLLLRLLHHSYQLQPTFVGHWSWRQPPVGLLSTRWLYDECQQWLLFNGRQQMPTAQYATAFALLRLSIIVLVRERCDRGPQKLIAIASLLADGLRVPLARVCIDNRTPQRCPFPIPDVQSCSRSHRTALHMMAEPS